jgi:hypothetical protein
MSMVVYVHMYVKEYVQTKEQNCLQEICKAKYSEMSIVESLDYKIVLVIFIS